QLDANGQPLHDLDEVARRVLRRQKRERLTGAHREAGDASFVFAAAAVHIDLAAHALADPQVGELRLLEISVDPNLADGPDRHQALTDLHVIAGIDAAPRDDAVDLAHDVAVAE